MRHAMPGKLLRDRLTELAATLGPLPHARLKIERGATDKGPADRAKKQATRLLKAECSNETCGYTVRVTGKWVRSLGPPHCPVHGAMVVEMADDEEMARDGEPVEPVEEKELEAV